VIYLIFDLLHFGAFINTPPHFFGLIQDNEQKIEATSGLVNEMASYFYYKLNQEYTLAFINGFITILL